MGKGNLKDNVNDLLQQLAALERSNLSPQRQKKAREEIEKGITALENRSHADEAAAIKGFSKQDKALDSHLTRAGAMHDVVNASLERLGALSGKDQDQVDDLVNAAMDEHRLERKGRQTTQKLDDDLQRRSQALKGTKAPLSDKEIEQRLRALRGAEAPASTKNPPTVSTPHPLSKPPVLGDLETKPANSKLEAKNPPPAKPANQGATGRPSPVRVDTKQASQSRVSASETLATIKSLQGQIRAENATSKRLQSEYNKGNKSPVIHHPKAPTDHHRNGTTLDAQK